MRSTWVSYLPKLEILKIILRLIILAKIETNFKNWDGKYTRKILLYRITRFTLAYDKENAYATITSRKSDVYSYGTVLLELIIRKKVLDDSSLMEKKKKSHCVVG